MRKINFHFVHGWAFDPSFWDNLRFELKKSFLDSYFFSYNLGFFGSEKIDVDFKKSSLNIFIVHSFGFNWLIKKKIKADLIFNFFGSPIFSDKKKISFNCPLDIMIKRFYQNPIPVIKAFYKKCGLDYKFRTNYKNFDSAKLSKSLAELKNDNLIKILEKKKCKIFSFFSDSDRILSFRNFDNLFLSLEHKTIFLEKEEHAYPFLKSFEASKIIKEILIKNFIYEK